MSAQLDLFGMCPKQNAQLLRQVDCVRAAALADELESMALCEVLPIMMIIDEVLPQPVSDAELIELARHGNYIDATAVREVLQCSLGDALERLRRMARDRLIHHKPDERGQPMAFSFVIDQPELAIPVKEVS